LLRLLTILTNKGTGIVTSVPSDSPDDYTALMVRQIHVCLYLANSCVVFLHIMWLVQTVDQWVCGWCFLLPLLTNKGTGIVTSVPSDSPDDYTALMVRAFRASVCKYGRTILCLTPAVYVPFVEDCFFYDAPATAQ
jgi:hypothetical protein